MPGGKRATGRPNGIHKGAEPDELKKARYLAGFSVDCTLTAGCKAAGCDNETVYKWREMDDAFVMAENKLKMALADRLEGEAIRRAYTGWEKPVYQKGELVGYERCYSDQLLKMMLGALRPEKFRENIHVSGQVEQIVRQVSGFNATEVL